MKSGERGEDLSAEFGTNEAVIAHFTAAAARVGLDPEMFISQTAGIPDLVSPGQEIDWKMVVFALADLKPTPTRDLRMEFYREFLTLYPRSDQLVTMMERIVSGPIFSGRTTILENQKDAERWYEETRDLAEETLAILQRRYDVTEDPAIKIVSSLDESSKQESASMLFLCEAGELLFHRMKEHLGTDPALALVQLMKTAAQVHVLSELTTAPDDVFLDAVNQIRLTEQMHKALTPGERGQDLTQRLLKAVDEGNSWSAADIFGTEAAYHALYIAGHDVFAQEGITEDPFKNLIDLACDRGAVLMGAYYGNSDDHRATLVFRMEPPIVSKQ